MSVALLALGSAGSLRAQAADHNREDVLAVVDRLFTAMRAKDSSGMLSLFDPGARLVGIRSRNGADFIQAISIADFVAFMMRDARGTWDERATEPVVQIDNTLATVWAAYTFHLGGTLTNCGTDAVQLLKTPTGWKIVSLADTYRTKCSESR